MELQLKLETLKKEKIGENSDKSIKQGMKPLTPKLPPFDDQKDELDAYLQRFERYATAQIGLNQTGL